MSNQGSTLTTCNGGATGLFKDIQRRLSTSGILPGLKPDTPGLSASTPTQNKPFKLKNVSNHAETFDSLHHTVVKVSSLLKF